jgi:hypothetical protein
VPVYEKVSRCVNDVMQTCMLIYLLYHYSPESLDFRSV